MAEGKNFHIPGESSATRIFRGPQELKYETTNLEAFDQDVALLKRRFDYFERRLEHKIDKHLGKRRSLLAGSDQESLKKRKLQQEQEKQDKNLALELQRRYDQ